MSIALSLRQSESLMRGGYARIRAGMGFGEACFAELRTKPLVFQLVGTES